MEPLSIVRIREKFDPSKFRKELGTNESLLKLSEDLISSAGIVDTLTKAAIDSLFIKSQKSYQAILELCKKGYGEDAGIILRSLQEGLINVLYILKEDSEKRAERYLHFEVVTRKELMDRIHKNSETFAEYGEIPPEKRKEINREFHEYQKKYGKIKKDEIKVDRINWSGKKIKDLATSVGMDWDYNFIFYSLSHVAHSNVKGTLEFLKNDIIKYATIVGPSENYIARALVTSYNYFLNIVKKWCEVFGLDKSKEIQKAEEFGLQTYK